MSDQLVAALRALLLPPSPEHQAAENYVNQFRQENPNGFVQLSLPVIIEPSLDPPVRALSMILVTQMFPDPKKAVENPLARFAPEIIAEILAKAFTCFGDANQTVRSNVARLFSVVAVCDVISTDAFGVIAQLIRELTTPSSLLALEGVFMVLIDILELSVLSTKELEAILNALFGFMRSGEVPDAVKIASLNMLRNLMDNMGQLLEEESNVKMLFECLVAMSKNPGTRASAFTVWARFTVLYYPMLKEIVSALANEAFVALANAVNERDVAIQVCGFWEAVTECEMDASAELNIIETVAGHLIPTLFQLSALVDDEDCDFEETFEPHVAAASTLQNVVACMKNKDQTRDILIRLVGEHARSASVGHREASLHCINFIIQFCDVSPVLADSLGAIAVGLKDGAARVRQTAIYCVHALLHSILTLGNECPFAAMIPALGHSIVPLSYEVMGLISDRNIETAATAASCMADFIRFPKFPYVNQAMTVLLEAALRGGVRLSDSAFSAMQNVVASIPEASVYGLLAIIVEIMPPMLQNPEEDCRIVNQLAWLLQNVLVRLQGELSDCFAVLLPIVDRAFQFPAWENSSSAFLSLLIPSVAVAAGPAFGAPRLQQLAEFLLGVIQGDDNESTFPRAAEGVSLLCDCFDMSPFAPQFLRSFALAVASEAIPLETKRFAASAIGSLAKSAPAVFCPLAADALAPVIDIVGSLGVIEDSLPDEEEAPVDFDHIILAFADSLKSGLEVLMAGQCAFAEPTFGALREFLEFVGGRKELGDYLVEGSVNILAYLISAFSEAQMKDFFADEPGFQVILQAAACAGVAPDAVNVVSSFCSHLDSL